MKFITTKFVTTKYYIPCIGRIHSQALCALVGAARKISVRGDKPHYNL